MSVQGEQFTTQVRYLSSKWRDTEETPRIFDRESRRANTEIHHVQIQNARSRGDEISLEDNGFQLFEFQAPIQDFTDSKLVTDRYHPAIKAKLQEISGADEVFITHHLIRTEDKSDFNKAYARFLHCDYSLATARSASLNLLRNRQIDTAPYEDADFAWYNTWQPFDHPVEQNPLTVIDASTIVKEDIVDYIYGGYGKSSKSSIPMYNPAHQFYYYSHMTPEEVLLIKQLDTRVDCANVSPHTSFILPDAATDTLPRRSIEVRMMAVFHK